MPRRPIRDWYTTEEAARFLGVSVARFRDFIAQRIFPHSEYVATCWLHYKGDLEKLKAEREKNPPRGGRKKTRPDKPKRPRGRPRKNAAADGNGPHEGNFPSGNTLPDGRQTAAPEPQQRKEG